MRFLRVLSASLFCGLALYGWAAASTKTKASNVSVSATISPNCTLSTQSLSFAYGPSQETSAITAQSAITTTCSKGSNVVISVAPTAGTNAPVVKGSQYAMKLAGGKFFLGYNLSFSKTRSSSSIALPPVPNDSPQTTYLYGTIGAGQHLPPGTYTDVVQVSINF